MDDLLVEFESLLDEYHSIIAASANDRDAYVIMHSHHLINEAARNVVEFLIDNNATVTFPSPAPDADDTVIVPCPKCGDSDEYMPMPTGSHAIECENCGHKFTYNHQPQDQTS